MKIPFFLSFLVSSSLAFAAPIRVLIIDGRNNHNWETTTDALRATLEATQMFEVTVSTAPESTSSPGLRAPQNVDTASQEKFSKAATIHQLLNLPAQEADRKAWETWLPEFSKYHCVVLNYNGNTWPEPMQKAFVKYIRDGGGALLIHAANNAFSGWEEYNDIIGMGWRKAGYGESLKVEDATGDTYVDDKAENSAHGSKHPFQVKVRAPEHPIMKDIPAAWMHGRDELYHNMRGPAKNLKILSSAYSDPKERGTGKHEPMTWEVTYEKGRSIVTSMGHFWRGDTQWDSLYCVGFQTIVARSCEYLATGAVTIPVPDSFPGKDEVSIVPPHSVNWKTGTATSASVAAISAQKKKQANPYVELTPEEQLTTFTIAPGYVAELVASEPMVQEPVLTAWDANGAMYVAEMRSYMQDEKGTGTKEPRNGRVKRLVDTDGDGKMDKATIFIDNLNLPRMILPLDDWIAVRETDTMDVIAYRDTDGDGVADEKKPLFEYGPRGRNGPGKSVEHQDSGLHWNLDNWIYITYNMERYRYTDGTWRPERQPDHWTQWGLTHDDEGRLFWSTNTNPASRIQVHPKYWFTVNRLAGKGINGDPITLGEPYSPEFMKVMATCLLNDRGGEYSNPVRAFTSACGQSVFRGDKLPQEDRGRYFVVDPTIHVLRRANIVREHGKIMLEKAEPDTDEFLLSSDINCRFVNTATGPDGTLYVTDMYRGIIQDAPWLSPGPRQFIKEVGLSENNQNGRIWRIRHKDFQPGKMPNMLNESTASLVRHLENPNGWWRDMAQRQIILRKDRETVIPLLESTFRYTQNRLARLHALWTLEGIGAVSDEILYEAFANTREPILRTAAIQIAEAQATKHLPELKKLAKDRDPRVAEQLILTLGTIEDGSGDEAIQEAARNHLGDRGVMMATTISLWGKQDLPLAKAVQDNSAFKKVPQADLSRVNSEWKAALANWNRGLKFPEDMSSTLKKHISSGETLYYKHCVTCHGADGKGIQVPGTDLALAPSLVTSKRVGGHPDKLIPVFTHGLIGPIDGKTYAAGFMAPADALGITRSDRLSELISYIRYAWGREASPVYDADVKRIRQKYESRKTPWTDPELK
jgi:glucose/arabinose dehydrogenase/mono/diheme cytochrome c family protein